MENFLINFLFGICFMQLALYLLRKQEEEKQKYEEEMLQLEREEFFEFFGPQATQEDIEKGLLRLAQSIEEFSSIVEDKSLYAGQVNFAERQAVSMKAQYALLSKIANDLGYHAYEDYRDYLKELEEKK
jgi:hypothetical protein